ncbi:hypothetical protein DOK76_12380 [Vagococcus sp. DIV0080]|uniref:Uncharacterized protein n=1 Tax=Candidatus Vagococcus giribetii TaxID=2230876 RepID=A0ABS3HVY9_9ENTE|nr:hypothetical protein [Vagococcus sp. DIV0080]MBO0477870.1 hypothetical protein [Vagococcus sp. DIV0080]
MVLDQTKKDVRVYDSKQKFVNKGTAEVTDVGVKLSNELSSGVTDARNTEEIVVRFLYKKFLGTKAGFIKIKGDSNLYSITKTVNVLGSTTFYARKSRELDKTEDV